MSFKNTFKKNLEDKKSLLLVKYKASKLVFIFSAFFFFLLFFMVGAGYKREILFTFISPFYIMLLVSLNLFIYYFLKKNFFDKKTIFYIILGIFIVFSILALFIII